MKNVSKIALAVFAAVGLAACSSNNGGGVEDFAAYSKTAQGQKDLEALAGNTAAAASAKQISDTEEKKQNNELITGSQTGAGHNQYAQFGVFRTGLTEKDKVGGVRYEAVVTAENKLDAEKALAVLTMKKDAPISATYQGKLAYSTKEKGESGKEHLAVNIATLELTLEDTKIAGTAEDNQNDRMFLFEKGSVYNHNNSLVYKGNVTVLTGKFLEREQGSYEGFFAGGTAPTGEKGKEAYTKENVANALAETAGEINTPSFHGAFDGKKQ